MPLGTEVGLVPDDIVLDGDPAPPPRKGAQQPSECSAHVCCGQTAGWIKMPLGTEVDLGPTTVLDGDRAPPPKGAQHPPLFGPRLLSPSGRPSQLLLSTCCISDYQQDARKAYFLVFKLLTGDFEVFRPAGATRSPIEWCLA